MNRRTWERTLALVLLDEDPPTALDRAIAATQDESLRACLGAIDRDGLRLSALLIARLRCERLLRGSAQASAWFDEDPAEFTAAFAAYHAKVPPRAYTPTQEALAFERFLGAAQPRPGRISSA